MINSTVYNSFIDVIDKPNTGCVALMEQCRALGVEGDPQFNADNATVNKFCGQIAQECGPVLTITSTYADRSEFDIAQVGPVRFPSNQHIAFFNQRWVQQDLGVPVNYTDNIDELALYSVGTSDTFRQNQSSIQYLLENDVQVALVYGDRDNRCNWIGAENVSLSVDYPSASKFRGAGYANIVTNATYNGGVVRQYDGFSFSRVFEAGHAVSAFQPQTASEIFERVMFRRDVATGKVHAGFFSFDWYGQWRSRMARFVKGGQKGGIPQRHYRSKGPSSSWGIKNKLPGDYPLACNVWAAGLTCTTDQLAALAKGTAVVRNNIVVSPVS